MWNSESWSAWREAEERTALAKPDRGEAIGNHAGTKRQRRPSVRLQDIGNHPAASTARIQKKIGIFVSTSSSSHSRVRDDVPVDLQADEPLEYGVANRFKTRRILKSRPLVLVNSGSLHEQTFSDNDGNDRERGTTSGDLASPSLPTPAESLQKPPYLPSEHVITRMSALKPPKVFISRVSNGDCKHVTTKATASSKVLPSTTPLSNANVEHATDSFSDDDKDNCMPEDFRDVDVETPEYVGDQKEVSSLQDDDTSKGGNIPLVQAQQEYKSEHVFGDSLLRQEKGILERSKERHLSEHVFKERPVRLEQGHRNMNDDGAASPLAEKANRQLAHDYKDDMDDQSLVEQSIKMDAKKGVKANENQRSKMEMHSLRHHSPFKMREEGCEHNCGQSLEEENILPHANKVKGANENQRSMEALPSNTEVHLAKHHSPCFNGVRGWLQNLGLSKYAQHFEVHEVDAEVLPWLTFDDLKEMGITAVGPRRKIYTAIRQLGSASL